MIDILDKKTLENRFAEDFGSPLFPILATMYLSEGDIYRARKVCEVGLDHDTSNVDGKFIFSKVAMYEEKYTAAEKLLKSVVNENPAHFNGLRMLIRLEIKLNRSPKTIQNYIKRLLRFIPEDSECKEWMEQLQSIPNESVSQEKVGVEIVTLKMRPKVVEAPKKTKSIGNKTYNVDKSMATFSMVQVLVSQKHFNQALAVLGVLESMGQDKNKIGKEKEEIMRHISESQ